VLWDVDYTLVHTPGVGVHLYQLAFADLYGRDLPVAAASASMAGRTDRAIALEVLALSGVADPPGEVGRFEACLSRLAPGMTAMVTERGRALPGAVEAVAALAAIAGVRQSLLTGNVRAMAEVKLTPFGLTEHLELDAGAYGNESEIRGDLVHLARRRAASLSAIGGAPDYGGAATVLIGDTPLDVEAALASGARAVAVATGRFTAEQLSDAGADVVLPDLTNTEQVLSAVLNRQPRRIDVT
jgi:phosphoglycolate phosphatase